MRFYSFTLFRYLLRVIILGSALLLLSGCWTKSPEPDEIFLINKKTLLMPPDYSLRPSTPEDQQSSKLTTLQQQAKDTLYKSDTSSSVTKTQEQNYTTIGQQEFIQSLTKDWETNEDIRAIIDQEDDSIEYSLQFIKDLFSLSK